MALFIPSVPIPSPLHPPPHSSHHNQNVCLAYVDGAFVIKGLLGGGDVLALIVLGVLAEHSSNCPPPPPWTFLCDSSLQNLLQRQCLITL